jgi:hypothetical protein
MRFHLSSEQVAIQDAVRGTLVRFLKALAPRLEA